MTITLDRAGLALHLAGSLGSLISSLSFPGLIFRKEVANKGHFKTEQKQSRKFTLSKVRRVSYMQGKEQ